MIDNIIKLGKILSDSDIDIEPFSMSKSVSKEQYIMEIYLNTNKSGNLYLEESKISQKGDKSIYLISPSKNINEGKTTHFYPHDFALSNSLINKESDGTFKVDSKKVNRNYDYTKDFYRNLDLDENLNRFLQDFYSFVLSQESNFIDEITEENKSFFKEISKKDLLNMIFSFVLSRDIIREYNLTVSEDKEFYYLGEIEEIPYLIEYKIFNESLKPVESGLRCSFCGSKDKVGAPSGSAFYFSFVKNQENVFYGLNECNRDQHLLMCKKCYKNYNLGKKYMGEYLNKKLVGINYFSTFDIKREDKNFERALEYIKENKINNIYTQENLKDLRNNLENNSSKYLLDSGVIGEESGIGISMFFYERNKKTNYKIRVLKTIKDVYPKRILDLLNANNNLSNFSFNVFLNSFFSNAKNDDYSLLNKWKLDLLEKMLLDIPINYDQLLEKFTKKASYQIRDSSRGETSTLTKRFLSFLNLLNLINCEIYSYNVDCEKFNREECNMNVDSYEDIEGKKGIEKLEDFLDANEFFKSTPEIRAGIPLGMIIERLTGKGNNQINNYDKRMLGFVRRKVSDVESLKEYSNKIEEKAIMHEMGGQWALKYFSEQLKDVFSKNEFSKNDFILGLFIGHSLSHKFVNDNPDKNKEGD